MLKFFLHGSVLALAVFAASARADLVINQILPPASYLGGTSSSGYLSQRFTESAYTYSNTVVVDDFTVTAATLDLTSITAVVDGFGTTFKSFSNVTGWEVAVYSSLNAAHSNVTGDVLDIVIPTTAATFSSPYSSNGDNNALLTLPVNLLLPSAGTYYLGVMGVNSFLTNGEIAIYSGGTVGNANAYGMNPGGSTIIVDRTMVALGKDAAYEIIGGPSAVPEPSVWAMVSIGAALLGVTLRRRIVG